MVAFPFCEDPVGSSGTVVVSGKTGSRPATRCAPISGGIASGLFSIHSPMALSKLSIFYSEQRVTVKKTCLLKILPAIVILFILPGSMHPRLQRDHLHLKRTTLQVVNITKVRILLLWLKFCFKRNRMNTNICMVAATSYTFRWELAGNSLN